MTESTSPGALLSELLRHRPDGAATWGLPQWTSPVGTGIFPLVVRPGDTLMPLGTAFCISKLGIIATALHNIREAVVHHRNGERLRSAAELPDGYHLDDIDVSVLHYWQPQQGTIQASFWPLKTVHGAPPTDLLLGVPVFQDQFPFLPLRITFTPPRIGEKVVATGYSEMSTPSGGVSLSAIESGQLAAQYSHQFLAVEGKVTQIFTQQLAGGYLRGPCFLFDAEVPHGMSGGPVLNAAGYVCGIVSAGASSFVGTPSTAAALFYPLLMQEVALSIEVGPVTINSRLRVVDMIGRGSILTDGSEVNVTLVLDGDEVLRTGIAITKEDVSHIHDDLGGFQSGQTATQEPGPVYHFKKKGNPEGGG